ncbi:MAG: two-component sensor histidine kinase [Eubacterium sp.]|nr:two-component sensor histidine kinase [Eubacterium sp.]
MRGNIVSNLIISSGYFSGENTQEVEAELEHISDIYDGRVLVVDSNLKVIRDTYGLEDGKTVILSEVLGVLDSKEIQTIKKNRENVEIYIPVIGADKESVYGGVVMNFSLRSVRNLYSNMSAVAVSVLVLFFIVIVAISLLLSARYTKPFKQLPGKIKSISNNDFGEQLLMDDNLETKNSSDAINDMITNVNHLEESRQEFVSNVSHELKTPITSINLLAQSLITQENVDVETYREFMQDISNEAERMDRIVNDLLALVKMDKQAGKLMLEEVNVNEFIEGILKGITAIAATRNIEIIFESVRSVTAQIDQVKLGMAFSNIIENAVKYNFDNGWVKVSLNADHRFFYLRISDSGIGIPNDLKDHIFERFYRVDKARSRETGGNGLGLAITKNAILMHNGTIKVHSVENQGTTFAVRIPLIADDIPDTNWEG